MARLQHLSPGDKVLFFGVVQAPNDDTDKEGGLIVVELEAPGEDGAMDWAMNPETPCTYVNDVDDVQIIKKIW